MNPKTELKKMVLLMLYNSPMGDLKLQLLVFIALQFKPDLLGFARYEAGPLGPRSQVLREILQELYLEKKIQRGDPYPISLWNILIGMFRFLVMVIKKGIKKFKWISSR